MDLFNEILQTLLSGISIGCVYGLVALGFVLIFKATEIINFAQGEMMVIGAFIACTLLGQLSGSSMELGRPFFSIIQTNVKPARSPGRERPGNRQRLEQT
jgi:branched-subunit amino acid ABC-type transport system permease component